MKRIWRVGGSRSRVCELCVCVATRELCGFTSSNTDRFVAGVQVEELSMFCVLISSIPQPSKIDKQHGTFFPTQDIFSPRLEITTVFFFANRRFFYSDVASGRHSFCSSSLLKDSNWYFQTSTLMLLLLMLLVYILPLNPYEMLSGGCSRVPHGYHHQCSEKKRGGEEGVGLSR